MARISEKPSESTTLVLKMSGRTEPTDVRNVLHQGKRPTVSKIQVQLNTFGKLYN